MCIFAIFQRLAANNVTCALAQIRWADTWNIMLCMFCILHFSSGPLESRQKDATMRYDFSAVQTAWESVRIGNTLHIA